MLNLQEDSIFKYPHFGGRSNLQGGWNNISHFDFTTSFFFFFFTEVWNNVPAATGKISVVKKFDDTFFGIYSGVAAMLDPLTRVTIERAYEAIIDAGMSASSFLISLVYFVSFLSHFKF